ncbi:hypothetical protein HY632_01850 [Candidatus Uhrbacteria bacterium]|nr:hypothetical protein [Candidatus Uhrbacteria bacterium]
MLVDNLDAVEGWMHQEIVDVVTDCAVLLRDHWMGGPLAFRRKLDGSMLSSWDVEVEQRISAVIARVDPGARIIGEEAIGESFRMRRTPGSVAYFIDPIDSTGTFVAREFAFCVSVTRVGGDGSIGAVIARPAHEEVFVASGSGLRCVRHRFSDPVLMEPRVVAPLRSPDPFVESDLLLVHSQFHRRVASEFPGKIRSYGSLIYHAINVARGTAVASVFPVGEPWDRLPILAIMRAVGGEVAVLHGAPLTVDHLLAQEFHGPPGHAPVLIAAHVETRALIERRLSYLPTVRRAHIATTLEPPREESP